MTQHPSKSNYIHWLMDLNFLGYGLPHTRSFDHVDLNLKDLIIKNDGSGRDHLRIRNNNANYVRFRNSFLLNHKKHKENYIDEIKKFTSIEELTKNVENSNILCWIEPTQRNIKLLYSVDDENSMTVGRYYKIKVVVRNHIYFVFKKYTNVDFNICQSGFKIPRNSKTQNFYARLKIIS